MLFWHLPWNLIRPHRMLIWLLPVPKIRPQHHQWQRNKKPHEQQRDHRGKWYSATARFTPYEEIQEETSTGNDCRIEGCSEKSRSLPFASLHCFVETRGKVACYEAHEHVEENCGGGKCPS